MCKYITLLERQREGERQRDAHKNVYACTHTSMHVSCRHLYMWCVCVHVSVYIYVYIYIYISIYRCMPP